MQPLHHVGYWVDDLEKGVDQAVRTLGIGPFRVHSHVRFDRFTLADGTEITDPAYFDHSAAFASWGSVVIELAEVHSAHTDNVAAYGINRGGLGHVSWVVDDLVAEIARLEAAGCPLIHTASTGAVSVAWHHGGPLFPHPIEVHQSGPPILGMKPALDALAKDWDGVDRIVPLVLPGHP